MCLPDDGKFNSLGLFTKGTKTNILNKLCRQFNTNVLEGCKTQADLRQATKEQQFRNIIGIGMETWSIVAHNINEWMQWNQPGGCAMMAMGRFSAEVMELGVDPSSLGHWCWLKVGSGNKKTRIVMAYQPSGSKSANSAGTTVREQHERYFEARGNLRSAHTIFFEQLIAQLIVWNIPIPILFSVMILMRTYILGTFSNASHNQPQCSASNVSNVPAFISPPKFRDGTIPIDAIFSTARIECVNA